MAVEISRSIAGTRGARALPLFGTIAVALLAVGTCEVAAAFSSFDPPPHCAHVMLLEGEADRARARGIAYEEEVELTVPGPTQRAVLRSALELMTPLLCHGVSRIAFGIVASAPGEGGIVKQLTAGDLILINEAAGYREEQLAASPERRLRMMHTVIHEAAHAAEALLNAAGARSGLAAPFAGEWTPSSRSLAQETLQRVRLRKSLILEWQRVHLSFVEQGWAAAYPRTPTAVAAVRERSASETVRSGFMSRYGGTSYAEDIADMVAWSYLAAHYRAAGVPEGVRQTEDYACQQMRAHERRELPSGFAAVYTKLHFLQDLGLVTAEDVDACIGDVGLAVQTPGFHFRQGEESLQSLGTGLRARIDARRGRYVYEMNGAGRAELDGVSHPAEVRLRLNLDPAQAPLEEVAWPRGIYPLGRLGNHDFELRLDGAPAGDFNAIDGFVLVAEASTRRIAGAVVVRVAYRLNAAIPVRETFDPPLRVAFLIETS